MSEQITERFTELERPQVTRAVIAAAGFGTRFLPFTKSMPKEMLPILETPVIEIIAEELVAAGIEDIVVVTSPHKQVIQEHLSERPSTELRENLLAGGKDAALERLERIHDMANFIFVHQNPKLAYGNAAPLLSARKIIGDAPFIYSYADDFVESKPKTRFAQLLDVYAERGGSVLTCLRKDAPEDFRRYGYVSGEPLTDTLTAVRTIVEKPGSKESAPSDLASVSGYLFENDILGYLQRQHTRLPAGEEFAIQTSIQDMINDGYAVRGLEVAGSYRDAGSPLELLKANIEIGLERPEYQRQLTAFILQTAARLSAE